MIKGLPHTFLFGSEMLFHNDSKEITEANVHLGFTFGEIEDHHDQIDFEKRTLDFNIVV
jgi:hypothetical protein